MIEGERWIIAVIALAGSLLMGEIAARIVRASMNGPGRSDEVREMARPVGRVLIVVSGAVGLFVALASTSRHAFEEIPDRIVERLPEVLLAGLILVVGYGVAIVASAGVAQSAIRASGRRQRGLERAVRWSVLGVSVALALGQIGVDTTLLALALAVIVGAPALTVALLTAFGGRSVAQEIAAGRAVRSHVRVGYHLDCGEISGLVVAVHPVAVEIETAIGEHVHVPYNLLLSNPYSVTPSRSNVSG
ncbi:MAG: hypothetical protein K1X38_06695 [Microthrixaceae bacterium]|nr:hypothetical protein [Microthrixaceae bacterium]